MGTIAEEFNKDFDFHAATPETGPMHERIRHTMKVAVGEVFNTCRVLPEADRLPSRELSLFRTAMEEAMFWANAHVARNMTGKEAS